MGLLSGIPTTNEAQGSPTLSERITGIENAVAESAACAHDLIQRLCPRGPTPAPPGAGGGLTRLQEASTSMADAVERIDMISCELRGMLEYLRASVG